MEDRWEDENLLMQLPVLTYCISSRKGFLEFCASLKMAHFLPMQSKLFPSGRKTLHLCEPLMQESMQNPVPGMPKKINPHTLKMFYRNACQRKNVGNASYMKYQSFILIKDIFQCLPLCALHLFAVFKSFDLG